MWRNWNLSALLLEMQNGSAIYGVSFDMLNMDLHMTHQFHSERYIQDHTLKQAQYTQVHRNTTNDI